MEINEPTNEQLLLMAINKASRARDVELNREAVEQYLIAFQGTDAELIHQAFQDVFRYQDNVRSMPSPKTVLARVREIQFDRDKRRALPEPDMDDKDRAYAKAIGPMVGQYLRGEITGEQMDQAFVSIAKAVGCYDRIKGQPGTVRDEL